MHRTYKEIGKHLANGWGREDNGNLNNLIRNMPIEAQTMCLLVSVLDELQDVYLEIRDFRYAIDEQEEHPVSDGMLQALRFSKGDIPIPKDKSALSGRARSALRRSRFQYLSEITEDNLVSVKNCGPVTRKELLNWAESLT